MKHMIYTHPEAEKQLSNLKGNQAIKETIHLLIDSDFKDLSVIRIEADPGNGSSHVLQAVGNKLKQLGKRITFLRFMEDESFASLSPYHHAEILSSPYLFIDNLQILLKNGSCEAFLNFLKQFAAHSGKLIYSSRNTSDDDEIKKIGACFNEKGAVFTLHPLNHEERKKWVSELIRGPISEEIPEEIFSDERSNQAFLQELAPFIQRFKRMRGEDHEFNRNYEDRVLEMRVVLRTLQLDLAKIQIEKSKTIRDQLYEKAADLREEERSILSALNELLKSFYTLKNELPFTPGMINLQFMARVLYEEFEGVTRAAETITLILEDRINTLKQQVHHLKETDQATLKKEVFKELMLWQEAYKKFDQRKKI